MNTARQQEGLSALIQAWFERIENLEQVTVGFTADINEIWQHIGVVDGQIIGLGQADTVLNGAIQTLTSTTALAVANINEDLSELRSDVDRDANRISELETGLAVAGQNLNAETYSRTSADSQLSDKIMSHDHSGGSEGVKIKWTDLDLDTDTINFGGLDIDNVGYVDGIHIAGHIHNGVAGMGEKINVLNLNGNGGAGFKAIRITSAQAITTNTSTTVIFNSTSRADCYMYNNCYNTATGKFKAWVGGIYHLIAGINTQSFTSSATIYIRFRNVTTNAIIDSFAYRCGSAATYAALRIESDVKLAANDEVVVEVFCSTSGGNVLEDDGALKAGSMFSANLMLVVA